MNLVTPTLIINCVFVGCSIVFGSIDHSQHCLMHVPHPPCVQLPKGTHLTLTQTQNPSLPVAVDIYVQEKVYFGYIWDKRVYNGGIFKGWSGRFGEVRT